MRAIVFRTKERTPALEDVGVKTPGPGEVRVRLHAAGLCHSDLSVIDGSIPYPTPVVLGHEGAGVVEAIGPQVTGLREGEPVVLSTLAHCGRCPACEVGRSTECRNAPRMLQPFTVDGKPAYQFANTSTFVESTVVKEQSAIPIDARVPFDCAALIGCGVMTGVGAVLNRARLEAGATMAVFGLGGIGLNCIQGGVLGGAAKIIAIDVVAQKLEWAKRFGATHTIDATKDDPVKAIRDLTAGGADYTFECVGNVKLMRAALESCHRGWGQSIIIGVAGAGQEISTRPFQLVTGRAWRGTAFGGARGRTDVPRIVDWYMDGRIEIDPMITHTMPLSDINKAFALMREGKSIRSVVVY